MGESIKEGGVGSSRDGGVNNGEGDGTIIVDKDFEADGEARVSSLQNGVGQVWPADADKIAFRVGGRAVPRGIESPRGTSEGRSTLGGSSLSDGRDFGGSGSRGRLLSFAFAPAGSSIRSNSLIEFAGATMDDNGIRMGGRGDSMLGRGVTGDCRRGGGTRWVRPD